MVVVRLLLQELLKCTPDDHEDIEPLKEALEAVKKAADYCDMSIKKREQNEILLALDKQIKGVDDLVQPHRRFIMEGPMKKLNRHGLKEYYMFLFSDILIYGKGKGSKVRWSTSHTLYNCSHYVIRFERT